MVELDFEKAGGLVPAITQDDATGMILMQAYMNREEWESSVERLHQQIPLLDARQIIVELARVANAVGDGHSGIRLLADPKIEFRAYPLKLHLLTDGLFVEAIEWRYAAAVGGRVTQIGKMTAQQAIAAVAPLIARDNKQDLKTFAPSLLVMPEVLDALGIIDDIKSARYVVEGEAGELVLDLEPGEIFHLIGHSQLDLRPRHGDWVAAYDRASMPTPLWRGDPDSEFWFEYLADSGIVYIQINAFADKEEETLEEFAGRVFDLVDSKGAGKVVIDLRWNRGGNNYLTRPFIRRIIQSPEIDQRGKLFTIIGHRTFSAAQSFVNRLENWTNVIFVGEPTAQNVNQFGDNKKIILPNSGIKVRASYLWWQDMDPRDTRRWTDPELATPLTSDDFRANRDPALEAIEHYTPRPSLDDLLETAFDTGGVEAALAAYHEFHGDPANSAIYTEPVINQAGYALLGLQMVDDAICFFQLNVEAYPKSANSYDSLAEAYTKQGNTERAIANYEKVLALDPMNENAIEMLERLRE